MKCCYISILTTDSYLNGALVLWKSLMSTSPKYPFSLLVSPILSKETLDTLKKHGIHTIEIVPIKNPILDDPKDRRYYNYSKLNMWNMTQYDKVVYLDADMVVLHNIDELFEKKNMSAVNAGGWIKKDWLQLNSGLLVLEPNSLVFENMKSKVGHIEKEKGKGDQAFLHQYYHDWPSKTELHLPHIYNVFDNHIGAYRKNFGYYIDEVQGKEYDFKRIKVIHYIGQIKPWDSIDSIEKSSKTDDETQANKIWVKYFRTL